MWMTEKHAATTWCSEARVYSIVQPRGTQQTTVVQNRERATNNPSPGTYCLGSKCAKWVWHSEGLNLPAPPDSYVSDDGPDGRCGLVKP